MQLVVRILVTSAVWALSLNAFGDGYITMRGAYYKEHATRVVQPMIDADLEVGENGTLQGHALVDSITSASAASGASGQPFNENRSELGGTYVHDFGNLRLGAGGRYSIEPDYQSRFLHFNAELDLAQKNSTLAFNIARGFDTIDNSGSQGGLSSLREGELDTTMASVSASQILTPESIVSASYDLMYLHGFQQNIYRTVVAGGMVAPERLPTSRIRHALATDLRYYVSPSQTILIGAYRFYADDWGIQGHAPELRVVQELLGGDLELFLSYRYYRQQGATFYQDIYDSGDMSITPYLSGDDRLGDMSSHTIGVKTGVTLRLLGVEGTWSEARLELLGQYLKQDTHYGDAVISQFALSFPIEY